MKMLINSIPNKKIIIIYCTTKYTYKCKPVDVKFYMVYGKNIYDLHHSAAIWMYENTFQHPNVFCCRGPMTSELIFKLSSYLHACE